MQKGSSLIWPSPKPEVQELHPPFRTCQEALLSQGTDYTSQFSKAGWRGIRCGQIYLSSELMLTLHKRKIFSSPYSFLLQDWTQGWKSLGLNFQHSSPDLACFRLLWKSDKSTLKSVNINNTQCNSDLKVLWASAWYMALHKQPLCCPNFRCTTLILLIFFFICGLQTAGHSSERLI